MALRRPPVRYQAQQQNPAERVIPVCSTGEVTVNFVLLLGQDVQVRVVDAQGNSVSGVALRVRYHEPEKPIWRVSFDHEEGRTDGNGLFLLRDVGIQVPFVVDVLAPDYPPTSSKRTKLETGDTKLEDIVLGEP